MTKTDLKELIGLRIKQRREELHLGTNALAAMAGIGWRNLYFIQKGRGISVPALLAIAEALGVSMDWLCGRGEEVAT